ncbi:MAG: dockerin type I repeat-containing protein [Candidatus Sumerlaeota bacterium]|nr:dockerin type I repeat-containing protein [Candidatus Sumerlaeota bacterium]
MIKHARIHLLLALAFISSLMLARSGEAKSPATLISTSIAGMTTPGSPDYPVGDIHYCGSALAQFERDISCAVIDADNGYAYFGTANMPGLVIKVVLGAGATTPTRIATLALNEDEGPLLCAVIDPAAGYAYFATGGGLIIKVALGSGDNSPQRVTAIQLNPSEINLGCAVIDPAAGFAYFGGYSYSNGGDWVAKVALGSGDNPPARVGAIALSNANGSLVSALMDATAGYAYFGTNGTPGQVIKVALGAGSELPHLVGAVTLAPGENDLQCGAIDAGADYAYFGTYAFSCVVKVALGTGETSPTRVSSATLDSWGSSPITAAIDPAAGYAYFANTRTVAKVSLGAGDAAPAQVSMVILSSLGITCSVIDPAAGYAYYGNAWTYAPGSVLKIALGAGNAAPSLAKTLALPSLESDLGSVALDTAAGYAYFGQSFGGAAPVCTIVKVAMSKGDAPPRRVGSTPLLSDERGVSCGAIDSAAGYGYFGSDAKIIKVALGSGDSPPMRIGRLEHGFFGSVTFGVLDPSLGYGYFVMYSSPSVILKVALGSGASLPTLVGSTALNYGERKVKCGLIDPAAGYAYFGEGDSYFSPGQVIKVALGSGANPPRRIGALTLNSGAESCLSFAAFAPESGFAYWGGQSAVVKTALGIGDAPPSRVKSVIYGKGSVAQRCVGIDPAAGWAFFGPDDNPFWNQLLDAVIVRMPLDDRNTTFSSIPIPIPATYYEDFGCAAYDAATGHAYYASNFNGTYISKFMKFDLLSDGILRRVGEVGMGVRAYNNITLDPAAGYGYFAGYGDGGQNQLAIFSLGRGPELPGNITSATLDTFAYLNSSLLIDPSAGYLYQNAFNHVDKIAASAGGNPPVRIGTIDLDSNDGGINCGGIDPAAGYAYYCTNGFSDFIKVALGNGASLPRRVCGLSAFHETPASVLIDAAKGYGYVGGGNTVGNEIASIYKIALGAGDTTPTLVSELPLPFGEGNLASAALDAGAGYAYFNVRSGTSKIVKVALGDGDSTPTRLGAVVMASDEEMMDQVAIDPVAGYGLFGDFMQSKIIKVSLGKGDALPVRLGGIFLSETGGALRSAAIDPGAGYAYFGMHYLPDHAGTLSKVAYSHKNYIKASRITVTQQATVIEARFYSHTAAGNLRLAIYDDSPARNLLWQSPSFANSAENAWISAPIADGTPSDLTLQPGAYWLAWQTDSTADVPSYTRAPGLRTGFRVDYLYGGFPAQIPATSATMTNELWSEYIFYSSPAGLGTVTVDVTPSSASWRLTDGNSAITMGTGGADLHNVPAGLIRLDWLPLDGFDPPLPNPALQPLPANGAITFTGHYTLPFDSLRRYLIGDLQILTPAQLQAADVNRDGMIDIADLIALLTGRGF